MTARGRSGGKGRTWNLMFLNCTVSTLNPIVGIVVTTSPICSRYKIVVFPLRSRGRVSRLREAIAVCGGFPCAGRRSSHVRAGGAGGV